MVAPAPEPADARPGAFDQPPCPLPPALRAEVAYRLACGHPWDAIGAALRYHPDALRRAAEGDPAFPAAQEKAWAQATREGEADGMRRLRLLANGCDDDRALKAAEILVKYARERRRDDTRLAVERTRAETRLAVEAARAERRAADAAEAEEEPGWPPPPPAPAETDEQRAARFAREEAAGAAGPGAEVYLWGGRHPLGRSVGPDASDTRVRVQADWSCGEGSRLVVYWVVPDPPPPEARMPGEPGATPDPAALALP